MKHGMKTKFSQRKTSNFLRDLKDLINQKVN
jgi:hypothetical protein